MDALDSMIVNYWDKFQLRKLMISSEKGMKRALLLIAFLVAYSLIVPSSTCFQVLNIQFFEGLMTLILAR